MPTHALPTLPSLQARRRSLLWRIHFWAALIASPFAMLAALTGLLYVFTPQIESQLYSPLREVQASGNRQSLDSLIDRATRHAPSGMVLHSVRPPFSPTDSVQLVFSADPNTAGEHARHGHVPAAAVDRGRLIMFVDPYTAQILGNLWENEQFSAWAQSLHASLLQGEGWRWLIELAASCLMIMLLTGIYLAWPASMSALLPRKGLQGRRWWRQWHALLGLALSLISLVILTTGLTWSKYAGEQIRSLRDMTGQAPPRAPKQLQSQAPDGATPLGWQAIWEHSRQQAPQTAMQLTPPKQPLGVWRAHSVNTAEPLKRFELLLDRYSGQGLYYAGWEQQTAFSKATAIGIPFHRGDFGWWNQGLLLLFGLGVVFSLVSGWVMYFQRRRHGASILPRLLPGSWRALPITAWPLLPILLLGMPVLAASSCVIALLEGWLHYRERAAIRQ
ncbi:PepSY-associated TM helix domain-containing protein [Chitinimonas sp. JJ19]|uniref:PepSY-associated TM helix domain-containing protein n=1 Tax=Chitinimonas sp. JJ19 TaxID=3109352 RepID=UPI0030007FC3